MPTKSQWTGIAVLVLIGVVFASVLMTHRVPEHETMAWKRDSAATARELRKDSIAHFYDSIQHRRDSLKHYYDSVHEHQDSMKAYWTAFYDSVRIEKERKKHIYDSVKALPREAQRHYWDSVYNRMDTVKDDTIRRDSVIYVRAIKKDTIIELNGADTTELMYIRGVGRYTAKKIVARKRALGGFYSASQLKELSIADTIISHFVANADSIRPLSLNRAKVETFVRHPYINIDQAKALYEHRRRRGNWKNINEVMESGIFDDESWEKIQHYLSME